MISTWGNQTTAYRYTGTQVWGQPTGTPQMECRGAGGIVPAPNARNANNVPAFRRSLTRAQRAPIPVAPAFTNLPPQRGCNRMGGPWDCSPRQIGMTRPDRAPPWFGLVFRMPPATFPPITSKLIYINARASAARFTHNVSKQGSSPARPRPRQVVAMRDGCPQGRCGAGYWCRGWPRPIRAGCGVPGGGAVRCPRAEIVGR